ncbi:hypothetical protein [Bacillus thuringiensis]|uniref:hypothetical protein n=1 Tax=Bacillus thuringiensis TaxID=1428 RepID=UPI00119CCB0E|nr:hypothetical protein [Bacillus thuringiensis]
MNTTLNKKGMELVDWKTRLDDSLKDEFMKEAMTDLICKKLNVEEAKIVLSAPSTKTLMSQLEGMSQYIMPQEDIISRKSIEITNSIKKHAQPVQSGRNWCQRQSQKQYQLKFAVDVNLEKNTAVVVKHIGLGAEFLKNYFKVSDDKKIKTLMRKNGFLHQYVDMRLYAVINKVLKGISDNHKQGIRISTSESYFASDVKVYNIDVRFEFSSKININNVGKQIAYMLRRLDDDVKLKEI